MANGFPAVVAMRQLLLSLLSGKKTSAKVL
jgi:hypothetical protein